MVQQKRSKKFKFGKIIISLLLCLFCSFSFVGCIGRMNLGGGGSSGGSSGSGSGGSSGGSNSGSGSGSGQDKPDDSEKKPSIDDFNDAFIGAIGVYEIEGTEKVFYDNNKKELMSYNELVDRQFTTIATYIYNSLNRIYGNGTGNSFVISGYGTDKNLQYAELIDNANQKILAGLSTGILNNKDYLNYKNSINGGYKLNVTENGDGTYSAVYDTNTTLTGNAWVGKDKFSVNHIKNALGYIYTHLHNVSNPNDSLTFASDTSLKTHYSTNFDITNAEVNNFDFSTISSLGISKEFVWNVAYYIAFSLIGQNNMDKSISNYNTVFSGSEITTLTSANVSIVKSALELYKGYNLVIADLLNNLVDLNISSSAQMSTNSPNWSKTCFTNVKKEMYIYYDTIEDVCDANNDGLGDEQEGSDDEDYEYDEDAMDMIDVGTCFKLKKIILVPYINVAQVNDFEVTGLLIGYQAKDDATYKVEMSISGLDNEGKDINPVSLVFAGDTNVQGNKVVFDDEYKLSKDLVDVTIDLGCKFSTMQTLSGDDIKPLIEGSFKSSTRKVEYDNGASKTINIGYINVNNNLFDSAGNFNVEKSILELNFDYYSENNVKLTEIPTTYLMYFNLF